MKTNNIVNFIHNLTYKDLPSNTIEQAKICILDLLGVAAAGHQTKLAKILLNFVKEQYPGNTPLLFSSSTASTAGASLFGGMLIDSIDAHDGQVLTKGHVGVAILPALLAIISKHPIDGEELITSLILGYEIATRAGIALHATAADYHTSGAWNCIGVAALASRIKKLSTSQTLEALGSAEFYGPRSQMMRCIDHPTMLKDGSGWGALTGISATLLAESGFTGSPAVTLFDDSVTDIWSDLGKRWYILEQYFKAYPVCRWAQPAVEAVREIKNKNNLNINDIDEIHIYTFHEATRLHVVQPETTEQAQYSLPFSVASALLDDSITAESIAETQDGIFSEERIKLSQKVITHEVDKYNSLFPEERWAHCRVTGKRELESSPCIAKGNPENPLTKEEFIHKFHSLSKNIISEEKREELIHQTFNLEKLTQEKIDNFLVNLTKL